MECIKEHLPHDSFETKDEIYKRGQQVKNFLKEFRQQNKLEGGEKIVCVSHSTLLSSVTASGFQG